MVKSTGSSFRGSGFDPMDPDDSSQVSITLVLVFLCILVTKWSFFLAQNSFAMTQLNLCYHY